MAAPAEWDTSKENFAPVRAGRTAKALVDVPSTPSKSTTAEVEERRKAFLEDIADSQEDPLPAWLRYVKWAQEAQHAAGGREAVLRVLEAATRALAAAERYYGDPRFLRLWLQYADALPDPTDVFLYLRDRGVGADLALLYEAYAAFLELKGAYSRAEAAYSEGVARGARPLDRLKQKHAAFEKRMAKRLQRQAHEASLGMASSDADTSGDAGRSALADLRRAGGVDDGGLDENGQQRVRRRAAAPLPQLPVVTGVTGAGSARAAAAGLLAGGSNLLAAAAAAAAPPSAAAAAAPAFAVCVDDEFQSDGAAAARAAGSFPPPLPPAFPPRLQHQPVLPGFAAVRKENHGEAGAWAGQRLKQDAARLGPAGPAKLDICTDDEFRDEDDDGDDSGQRGANAAASAAAAGAAKATARGAGLLQHHALSPVPEAAAVAPPPQPAVVAPAAAAAAAPAVAAGVAAPTGGYLASLLVGPDGREQCFEEARAAAYFARPWRLAQPPTVAAAPVADVEPATCEPAEQQQVEEEQHPQDVVQHEEVVEQQQDDQQPPIEDQQQSVAAGEQPCEPCGLGDANLSAPHEEEEAEPVAAVVFASVDDAPQQPRDGDASLQQQQQEQQPPSEPQCDVAGDSGTGGLSAPSGGPPALDHSMTMSTRAALSAVNGMFSADLTASLAPPPGVVRGGSGGGRDSLPAPRPGRRSVCLTGGLADPTVTMSTRAALAAVNNMFNADLTTTAAPSPLVSRSSTGRPSLAAGMGAFAPGAEPTMTMATREAAALVAGMFADERPAAGAGAGGGRRNSRRSSIAPAGGFALYEDTEFIGGQQPQQQRDSTGGHAAPAAAGLPVPRSRNSRRSSIAPAGGFALYEDTEFIGGGGAQQQQQQRDSTGGHAVPSAAGVPAPRSRNSRRSSIAPAGGFALYEDTEFIGGRAADAAAAAAVRRNSRRSSIAPVGGFGLYEDTEFITRPVAGGGGGGSGNSTGPTPGGVACAPTQPVAGAATGATAATLALYEDTEFITGGPRAGGGGGRRSAAGHAGGGPGDTEYLTARCSPPRPSLAAAPADTAAAAPTVAVSSMVTDENAAPAEAPGSGSGGSPARGSPAAEPGAFGARCDSFDVLSVPDAAREPLSAGPSPDKEGPKENAPPCDGTAADGGAALCHRSLADPSVRAAALQPLAPERAAALGIALDGGSGGSSSPALENEGVAAAAGAAHSPSRRALRALFQQQPGDEEP